MFAIVKKKGGVILAHYGGLRAGVCGIAPLILNLGVLSSSTTPSPLYCWESTPVFIERTDGWALELVWTFLENRKLRAPAGIRSQDRTARI
jgi:hypothetical protein